jgi:hypothetical protein
VSGSKSGLGPQSTGVVACHASLAGPRLDDPVQLWSGPRACAVCACVGRAGGVVTVRGPRAGRCGGALTNGPVVASRRQGVAGELVGTTGRAPGKEGAGRAH